MLALFESALINDRFTCASLNLGQHQHLSRYYLATLPAPELVVSVGGIACVVSPVQPSDNLHKATHTADLKPS